MGTKETFPATKEAGVCVADYIYPLSNAEVWNLWSYTSTAK